MKGNEELTSNSDVEKSCYNRWSLHVVHTIICQPMEGFQKEQNCEESHKLVTEVVPEHSECKACLRDGIEETLNQVLSEMQ